MRMALTAWNMPGQSMARRIEALAALGFGAVSVRDTVPPVSPFVSSGRFHALVERYDLDVLVHGALGSEDRAEDGAAVAAYVEAIARFHEICGRVRLASYDPGTKRLPHGRVGFSPDHTWDMLETVVERLAPLNIPVALENWAMNTTHACYRDLARRFGHETVGMLLDIGHLHIASSSGALDETCAEFVDRVPVPIYEVHVHDNHGTRDEHLALGRGSVRLAPIARVLLGRGFDGYVTVEVVNVHPRRADPFVGIVETRDAAMAAFGFGRMCVATIRVGDVSKSMPGDPRRLDSSARAGWEG